MDVWIVLLSLLVLIGSVASDYQPAYSSVAVAVASLPELSVLNAQVNKVSLSDQLKQPSFVGTVFAPINTGLQPLVDALGGDLTALGSASQVNDIFSTSVLTTKILLEQLFDGQKLTTMNGNTVTVSIKTQNGGKLYYINSARITTANILAGQAVIHEVTPILLPTSYQSLYDSMGFQDTTAVVPTAVFANPTTTSTDTSSGSSTSSGGSSSGSTSTGTSGSTTTGGSGSGSTSTTTSGSTSGSSGSTSPTPGGSTTANPASPSPTPSGTSSSPAPGGTTTLPSPGSTGSSTSTGSTGTAPTGSSGSTSSTTNSGSTTGAGSTPSGSTGTSTVPNTGSTAEGSSSPTGSSTVISTGSTATTSTTSTTSSPSTTSAVTTESAKVDPDYGLDISAGRQTVLATALLAVPLLVAAVL